MRGSIWACLCSWYKGEAPMLQKTLYPNFLMICYILSGYYLSGSCFAVVWLTVFCLFLVVMRVGLWSVLVEILIILSLVQQGGCHNYPRAFLKSAGDIAIAPVCLSICPSVCLSVRASVCASLSPSVTLSPPKPLEEIQLNFVCELLTWMGCATAHLFVPAPSGPGEGSKGQI